MKQKLFFILGLFVLILSICAFGLITTETHINGDGAVHNLIISEILSTGELPSQHPYRLITGENTDTRYPIHYTFYFYTSASVIRLFTDENFLKYFGLIMTSVSILFLILFLKRYINYNAFLAAPLLLFYLSKRIIMSPLMEPLILMLALASLYCLIRYKEKSDYAYLILAGIFLGGLIATKVQGLIYTLSMFLAILFYNLIMFLKHKEIKRKNILLLLPFLIGFLLSAPFLADQNNRTSTLFYSPGEVVEITSLLGENNSLGDLFKSNIPIDHEAVNAIDSIIGYRPTTNSNLFDTLKQYALYPFLNFRSSSINYQESAPAILIGIGIFTIFFFFMYLFRKNIFTFYLLFFIFLIEILEVFLFNHSLYQYYPLALSIIVSSISIAIIKIPNFFSKNKKTIIVYTILLFFIFYFYAVTSFQNNVNTSSERESDELMSGYNTMAKTIQERVSGEEIIITSGVYSSIYKRYSLWINEGGGADIKTIFWTNNTSLARNLAIKNNAGYLLYDTSQITRKGVFDTIPNDGLASVINNTKDFRLIKKINTGNYTIFLYQVK